MSGPSGVLQLPGDIFVTDWPVWGPSLFTREDIFDLVKQLHVVIIYGIYIFFFDS